MFSAFIAKRPINIAWFPSNQSPPSAMNEMALLGWVVLSEKEMAQTE